MVDISNFGSATWAAGNLFDLDLDPRYKGAGRDNEPEICGLQVMADGSAVLTAY